MTKSSKKKSFVDPIWVKGLFPSSGVNDLMPVQVIKDNMRPIVAAGEYQTCACCGQTVKIYPRNVNSTMLKQLVHMLRRPMLPGELMSMGGDYAKLGIWDLAKKINFPDGKARWTITQAGRDFLMSQKPIPKYALVYDDETYGWSREQWSAHDSAGKKFDLDEVLTPFELVEAAE